tara:strand:+ start:1579 stop:2136 length:558 start_codon:yes stop_codon:yes gene_type:complete
MSSERGWHNHGNNPLGSPTNRRRSELSIMKQGEMPVLGTDLKITGFGTDINGNTVINLKQRYASLGINKERGFSIQTNGNLPMIHARRNRGIRFQGEPMASSSRPSGTDMVLMSQEIANYIRSFGTKRQNKMLNSQTGLMVGANRMADAYGDGEIMWTYGPQGNPTTPYRYKWYDRRNSDMRRLR